MDGVTPAGTGHTLADLESIHSRTQVDNRPGGRISKRHGLVEAVEGGLKRGNHAIPFHFVEHLPEQVGAGAGLADQGFFGKLDQHPFGAGRNERSGHPHQSLTGARRGDRDLGDEGLSIAHVLKELFHGRIVNGFFVDFRHEGPVSESIPQVEKDLAKPLCLQPSIINNPKTLVI